MRVLFIEPPFERFIGFRCEWFPMGLVSLSTYLEKKGHHSRVYNAEHDNNLPYLDIESYADNFHLYSQALKDDQNAIWQELHSVIVNYNPDVVGISIKTVKEPSALKIAEITKRISPDIKIVAGGPHPTVSPEEILALPFFDYVVKGEGEETMAQMVEALYKDSDLRDVPGISYRNKGKVYHNPLRPLIRNLEDLPKPDRKFLIDYNDYTPNQLGWLMTSRGCPYDCAYCSSKSIWSRKVRYRTLEDVLDEIHELRVEHGVTNLNFMDDSFTVNRKYLFNLCNAFIEKKLKMTWSCLTRADLMDADTIRKMKSAGCTKVDIGVESGSQKVQKIIKKGIDLDQVRKIAKLLRKNNMFWAGFFMMGFPGETKKDILKTLKFMKEIKPNWVCFSIFTPYPGTALFEKAKELNLIPKEFDFSLYAHQSPDNCFSEKISPEEFQKISKMMFREFHRYNASFHTLFRRFLTKNYLSNPKLFLLDFKKWLSWILPLNRNKV